MERLRGKKGALTSLGGKKKGRKPRPVVRSCWPLKSEIKNQRPVTGSQELSASDEKVGERHPTSSTLAGKRGGRKAR